MDGPDCQRLSPPGRLREGPTITGRTAVHRMRYGRLHTQLATGRCGENKNDGEHIV